ncbi:hypothetical protein ACSL103130_05445 [Actinomyces slackii]|uniref:Uncharacterized protein n=1 Tax=Actinomyces slackii TaxID=52774 RepID=A0A3S4SSQ8_9ACTO|nr:hypothetical protein [Actinomyces slackii]VEG74141.1 Uncharacterised protein [Actinomyces slackii]
MVLGLAMMMRWMRISPVTISRRLSLYSMLPVRTPSIIDAYFLILVAEIVIAQAVVLTGTAIWAANTDELFAAVLRLRIIVIILVLLVPMSEMMTVDVIRLRERTPRHAARLTALARFSLIAVVSCGAAWADDSGARDALVHAALEGGRLPYALGMTVPLMWLSVYASWRVCHRLYLGRSRG